MQHRLYYTHFHIALAFCKPQNCDAELEIAVFEHSISWGSFLQVCFEKIRMPNPLAEQLLHQITCFAFSAAAINRWLFIMQSSGLPKAYQQYGAVLPRMEVEMSILPDLAISPASTWCHMHVQLCNPRENRGSQNDRKESICDFTCFLACNIRIPGTNPVEFYPKFTFEICIPSRNSGYHHS